MTKLVAVIVSVMVALGGCSNTHITTVVSDAHADNCECDVCWMELERVEHMYE